MKKTHKLENGTILEEGKKYTRKEYNDVIEVLYLGEQGYLFKDSIGDEWLHPYEAFDLTPYSETTAPRR